MQVDEVFGVAEIYSKLFPTQRNSSKNQTPSNDLKVVDLKKEHLLASTFIIEK